MWLFDEVVVDVVEKFILFYEFVVCVEVKGFLIGLGI